MQVKITKVGLAQSEFIFCTAGWNEEVPDDKGKAPNDHLHLHSDEHVWNGTVSEQILEFFRKYKEWISDVCCEGIVHLIDSTKPFPTTSSPAVMTPTLALIVGVSEVEDEANSSDPHTATAIDREASPDSTLSFDTKSNLSKPHPQTTSIADTEVDGILGHPKRISPRLTTSSCVDKRSVSAKKND